MCNGMRCLLAVLATAVAAPTVRADDDQTQIKMAIRIIRTDDAGFERIRAICATPSVGRSCSACAEVTCCAARLIGCGSCPKSTCCECVGVDRCTSPAAFLPSTMTSCQVARLFRCVEQEKGCQIMSSPMVTALCGQCATVETREQRAFVTDIRNVEMNGQTVAMPINEFLNAGTSIAVTARLTPDRTAIILSLNAQMRDIDAVAPPQFPIQSSIAPVYEDGFQGQPVPVTQFIQQPSVTTRGVQKTIGVPCGNTAVVYAGRRSFVRESCCAVPFLCDLPVIGDLFRFRAANVANDHLLVLVTPEVVAETSAAVQAPACFDLPIMCDEAVQTVGHATEECVPVAPKPVRTANCPQSCPAPCADAASRALTACPQTSEACPARPCTVAGSCRGASCPITAAVCPCPTACPCPTPQALCPMMAAVAAPSAAPASLAFVLLPIHQFGWQPAATCAMPSQVVSLPTSVHCRAEEEQSARAPANPQLAKLMAKYRKACDAGNTEKARKLANKCLVIDPTCFAK